MTQIFHIFHAWNPEPYLGFDAGVCYNNEH